MKTVEKTSILTILFSLEWQKEGVQHTEQFYADKINLWRDVMPGAMVEALLGKTAGDVVKVHIAPHEFNTPYSETLIQSILTSQFKPPSEFSGKDFQPERGRFYPKGYLTGLSGVFRVSTAPCRFIHHKDGKLVFDLNHPLGGHYLTISAIIIEIDNVTKERGGRCQDWMEMITENGPGMQSFYHGNGNNFDVKELFVRDDEENDKLFYEKPRLVQHLDSTALKLLSDQYDRIIPPGSAVLDLMGSWDSHINENKDIQSLTVLGLNHAEMQENKRASTDVVHDLNTSPQLPFNDNSFDAIVCTASIEYLKNPLDVLKDAARVLKKDGVIAISFSNRWFATKAIAVWSKLHEFERIGLVIELLSATESFEDLKSLSIRGYPRPEDDPHSHLYLSDPVYLVSARKK